MVEMPKTNPPISSFLHLLYYIFSSCFQYKTMTRREWIMVVVILGLLIWVFRPKTGNSDYKQLENQIELSDKRIDSLSNANAVLELKISDYTQRINTINNQLDNNSAEIYKLKLDYQDSLNKIDTYSYDELYNSIINRYNQ